MKNFPLYIIAYLIFISMLAGYSCSKRQLPAKEIVYVPIEESKLTRDSLNKYVECLEVTRRRADSIEVLINKLDSFRNTNDSLSAQLVIRDLKIERIRYYNEVAGKGSNIKFLRGWINRVIEE